jgi:hypothetical protein
MTISKTISTLSLALAFQASAFVAAAVVLSPSDATAATKHTTQKKAQKKPQKKAHSVSRLQLSNSSPDAPQNSQHEDRDENNLSKIQAELNRKMNNHRANSSIIRAVGDNEHPISRNMN